MSCESGQSIPFVPYIGSISASPTGFLLRGHGRGGTQNVRLAEAVILGPATSMPTP